MTTTRQRLTAALASLALTSATLLALTAATTAPAHAATADISPYPDPLPLEKAGALHMWGDHDFTEDPEADAGQNQVPDDLKGVAISQVVTTGQVSMALTATGKVKVWGVSFARLNRVPDEVQNEKVAQIALTGSHAAVVTRSGKVFLWGQRYPVVTEHLIEVPANLKPVKQLVFSQSHAVVLHTDGTISAWGHQADFLRSTMPPGLTATRIFASRTSNDVYALKPDGSLVAFGGDAPFPPHQPDPIYPPALPAAVTQPGSVKSFATSGYVWTGSIALLNDGTLLHWTRQGIRPLPAWTSTLTPATVGYSSTHDFAILDTAGTVHSWSYQDPTHRTAPAEHTGPTLAAYSHTANTWQTPTGSGDTMGASILTKVLRADDPTISGAPTVGQTLTATPGTFSGAPTTVTGQWNADGAAIAGATGTTLVLGAAHAGKKITYTSSATKAAESATSTSQSVTVTAGSTVTPAGQPVGSSTSVTAEGTKKGKSLTVSGTVTATKPVTGTVTLTIKKGKKVIAVKKVATTGTFKVTVKKFSRMVAKKLKAKGKKARTAYRGAYSVTASYSGGPNVNASASSTRVKLK